MSARPLMLALALLPQIVAAAPVSPDHVSVTLIATRTFPGEPTRDADTAGRTLGVDEDGSVYLLTGVRTAGRPDRALCLHQVGTPRPRSELISQSVYLWTAKAHVVSVTMESIVLDIDWMREHVEANGSLSRVAGDRRRVTFKEGDRQTLDFLDSETPEDECGLSLRVDLSVSMKEDPRFADDRIRYEMWVIDQPPRGEAIVRKCEAAGGQGEKVSLPLEPLRWDLPGATFKDGRGAQAAVTITGEVRGRIRDDGQIDVLLRAGRFIGVVEAGDRNAGGNGDGGEKSLTIAPGETVGFTLPPVRGGSHTLWLDAEKGQTIGVDASTDPVSITRDSVTLNNEAFFRGHTMSLRLTATRVGP